nr:MAG TPA: hypothetical protein [Caudoviricetes sp.]
MLSVARTYPHNLANRGISASVFFIWITNTQILYTYVRLYL